MGIPILLQKLQRFERNKMHRGLSQKEKTRFRHVHTWHYNDDNDLLPKIGVTIQHKIQTRDLDFTNFFFIDTNRNFECLTTEER